MYKKKKKPHEKSTKTDTQNKTGMMRKQYSIHIVSLKTYSCMLLKSKLEHINFVLANMSA